MGQVAGAAGSLALGVSALRAGAAEKEHTNSSMKSSVDRASVVRRHNPAVRAIDPFAALSVGNGEFAFTADVTGLQTFLEPYKREFPLCTASHWGWHSRPLPADLRVEDFRYTNFDTYGRPVPYATDKTGQERLFNWLRENPHRLHLGRVGLEMTKANGSPVKPDDLRNIRQTLDLWGGILYSRFEVEGKPVSVVTCCHPDLDMIAVRVESPLIAAGQLRVLVAFPYGSPTVPMADWGSPERHETVFKRRNGNRVDFQRRLDEDRYAVSLGWAGEASVTERKKHEYVVAANEKVLEFTFLCAPELPEGELPGVAPTEAASRAHWQRFWSEGGAIDFSGSTAPGAEELERRVVLSQYQTALHCAGSLPSAETGLLFNSWYGKFHLEMHWWHSVHFTLWDRFPLFQKSIGIYHRILPQAREMARRQGYQGARWPKMIGPDGRDSPSPVGPLLIWQQPHPIYYAELCYRQAPTRDTLEAWREIVFETADFMASYAIFDERQGHFVLGPPLKTVSENYPATTARNPTFELAYWRFGLRSAQTWRERLGLLREPQWDRVLQQLAPLPQQDGLYLMQEGMTATYTQWNWEHPALVGACGMQPGDGVETEVMRRSVRKVMECWQWEQKSWGWDYPLTAMAAARTGQPELAVQALLLAANRNRYHPNGHNYQRPELTAYLPGNGGLLTAVAMMAAGWSGAPDHHAPGFPEGGTWNVRWEGLKPLF